MNEQLIQQLKQLVSELMQIVDQMGDLDDEDMEIVAQVMEHVANRIIQLRQGESSADGLPPSGPSTEDLQSGGPSSNINSFAYDDKTGKLLVKFQGDYPQENGPIYGYEGVPKQIYELFRRGAVPARTNGQNKWGKWWKGKVPSLGASMFTLIKNGGYSYSRLS